MGNTCKPMAVSFQCMTKSTTNKKKKKKENQKQNQNKTKPWYLTSLEKSECLAPLGPHSDVATLAEAEQLQAPVAAVCSRWSIIVPATL